MCMCFRHRCDFGRQLRCVNDDRSVFSDSFSNLVAVTSVGMRVSSHNHAKSWWKRMEVVTAGGHPGRQWICKAYFKGSYCLQSIKWWLTVGCCRDRLRHPKLWVSVPRKFKFADYQFQVDKGADKTEETRLCATRFISTEDCVCAFRKFEITRW